MRRAVVLLTLLALSGCAEPPTEEERILRAVEEALAASAARDAPALWSALSETQRNRFAEIRGLAAGELPKGRDDWLDQAVGLLSEEDRVAARTQSDYEFFRNRLAPSGMPWSRGEGSPRVTVEGETARVRWPTEPVCWHLRRERGGWRVAMVLEGPFADMALVSHVGPGGREYLLPETTVWLSRKEQHEVPLPRVAGDAPLDESVAIRVRVALERDGSYVVKGERIGLEALRKKLGVYAERQRDLDHPWQPSVVPVALAVHRELTWGDVDRVLRLVAGGEIRACRAEFLTKEEGWTSRAIPVRLGARPPIRVKWPEPFVVIRVGVVPVTPGHLAALEEILDDGTPGTMVAQGVRVEIDARLGVEPALRLLMTVARCVPPETEMILCVAKEKLPAKLTIGDGFEIEPIDGGKPGESPVTLPLTMDPRD
jgi:hypothetical protein